MSGLWDPGLQPERTALAWQRTALATAVAALAVTRLAVHRAAVPALAIAALAAGSAALTLVFSAAAYRRTVRCLTERRPLDPLGPALPTTVAIALLGVAVLLTVP